MVQRFHTLNGREQLPTCPPGSVVYLPVAFISLYRFFGRRSLPRADEILTQLVDLIWKVLLVEAADVSLPHKGIAAAVWRIESRPAVPRGIWPSFACAFLQQDVLVE